MKMRWLLLQTLGWLLLATACSRGPHPGREMLADPALRFRPADPLRPLAWPDQQPREVLPPGVVELSTQVAADPGADARATTSISRARGTVPLFAGLAGEVGYTTSYASRRQYKFDGFTGGWQQSQLRHGPDVALLADDGSSLLRLGYELRLGWEGWAHRPGLRARTTALGHDSLFEGGYHHELRFVEVSYAERPARRPIAARRTSDHLWLAWEQGILPAWNLRLEVAAEVQDGFLQSPYRLVTLWSGRSQQSAAEYRGRSEPESHPDHRLLWGAQLRVRLALSKLGAVAELGAGAGSGSWRVERQQLQVGWGQRLGEHWLLRLAAGAYHQTRASFYRNEYDGPPPGSYFSADWELSSYLAWWASLGAEWTIYATRDRVLGMFRYLRLELTARVDDRLFDWQGLDHPAGFSGWSSIAGGARQPFAAGLSIGGWLVMEGGI